jgi:LmbE family N-acetylglucosaminyl deacetylase
MKAPKRPPLKPNVVLAVGAHPDDIDFCAGGTMAKYAAQGADVYYLIVTDGCQGSRDRKVHTKKLVETRNHEQKQALKIIGGRDVIFFDYHDSQLEATQELKQRLVRVIRQLKPDVVVTMDPSMIYAAEQNYINHPDHRAAGQATLDAVFPLARDHLACPELLDEGFEPHNTPTVLLCNFVDNNFYEDISDYFDLKLKALRQHGSQFNNFGYLHAKLHDIAEACGKVCDCAYAEGFIRLDIPS